MKNKGRVVLGIILSVAVLAAFTLAYAATKAPEKPITIESKDVFKKFKQGPVIFNHAKHKAAPCTTCHHVYENGKNVWKEGQEVKKCDACHKLKAEGKVPGLEKAFHKRCQGCHKKLKKEKKPAGPTVCNKCHQKKAAAAGEKK
ncbi:MAG: cytochrome c3 family protein [Desulfomonilaceae bacterium]